MLENPIETGEHRKLIQIEMKWNLLVVDKMNMKKNANENYRSGILKDGRKIFFKNKDKNK